jgi:hypothetical protein
MAAENPRTYASFITEFCEAAEIENVGEAVDLGKIRVNGVDFIFFHEGIESGTVTVACPLSTPSSISKEARYRRMLEMNMDLLYQDGPRIIVDKASGTECLIYRLHIANTSGAHLALVMYQCSEIAKAWNSGALASDAPPENFLSGLNQQLTSAILSAA